jgi:predicted nucleotidyltransferase
MMTYYKTSFEQIRQNPALSIMLQALERGLKKFNIDYYLIGAVSRDVWMSGLNNIHARRTTGDIDFAVFINDKGIYEKLKEYLTTVEGFNPYRENSFVLIYKDGTEVDLLPFGAIEDENRKATIEGTGLTSIHVDGIKEVFESLLPEIDLEGHIFKFCTLPGIVLLKLIAWSDRPEVRRDDIKDISDILNHFFSIYQDIIWEEHSDLFNNESDLIGIAAHVMGREIAKILKQSEKLRLRVLGILEENTITSESSTMAIIMREYFETTVEDSFKLIQEIKQGIVESKSVM